MTRYLPDYLKGFEEIDSMLEAARVNLNVFDNNIGFMLRRLRMESNSEKWEKFIHVKATRIENYDTYKVVHGKFPVVTIKELEYFLTAWLDEGKFTLSYDAENGVFTLNTTQHLEIDESREYIRNLFPLNCELVINVVKNL